MKIAEVQAFPFSAGLWIWDTSTGHGFGIPQALAGSRENIGRAANVAFPADDSRLAVALAAPGPEPETTVSVWDTSSGKLQDEVIRTAGGVGAMAFQPAGNLVAIAVQRDRLLVWRLPQKP